MKALVSTRQRPSAKCCLCNTRLKTALWSVLSPFTNVNFS